MFLEGYSLCGKSPRTGKLLLFGLIPIGKCRHTGDLRLWERLTCRVAVDNWPAPVTTPDFYTHPDPLEQTWVASAEDLADELFGACAEPPELGPEFADNVVTPAERAQLRLTLSAHLSMLWVLSVGPMIIIAQRYKSWIPIVGLAVEGLTLYALLHRKRLGASVSLALAQARARLVVMAKRLATNVVFAYRGVAVMWSFAGTAFWFRIGKGDLPDIKSVGLLQMALAVGAVTTFVVFVEAAKTGYPLYPVAYLGLQGWRLLMFFGSDREADQIEKAYEEATLEMARRRERRLAVEEEYVDGRTWIDQPPRGERQRYRRRR